ncbi:M23 family metallopeptidase [Nocardiopsis sp. RV163]|uniref:M23 family metallopeptidase n=1 Tax=Nocardiopsis sp. RV163 TaxID=1661388 RepID=UPI0009E486F0
MPPPATPGLRSPVSRTRPLSVAAVAVTASAVLAVTASTAHAQPITAQTPLTSADNVEITVDSGTAEALPGGSAAASAEDVLAESVVADVLRERNSSLGALSRQERDVRVDVREAADGAAFGVAIVTAPMNVDESPYAWLFAADYEGSAWTVGLEGTEEFSSILADSALLEEEERETVAASTDPSGVSTSSYTGVGLPFAIGSSMIMTGGPHGNSGGRPYSSVDFAGGSGQARAARGGYAYSLCTGWTRVIHDNGYSTDYYHLENYQWLPGNNVGVGHYLGTQGNSLCAGGSTTGAHIHFSLRGYSDPNAAGWYVALHGRTLGGWTFVEGAAYGGYAYRNGVGTVYPGGSMYNYGF